MKRKGSKLRRVNHPRGHVDVAHAGEGKKVTMWSLDGNFYILSLERDMAGKYCVNSRGTCDGIKRGFAEK